MSSKVNDGNLQSQRMKILENKKNENVLAEFSREKIVEFSFLNSKLIALGKGIFPLKNLFEMKSCKWIIKIKTWNLIIASKIM